MCSRRKTYTGVGILLVASLLMAGCPPKTVIVDGREITLTEAAELAYQDARQAAEAGQIEQAIQQYELFLTSYPDSEQTDEALSALADLYYQTGNYQKAVEHFRSIVVDHPHSPHYLHAAIQLGTALFKLGRTQEALPTLQSVFDQLPSTQKKAEVAGMLAEACVEAQAPVEALRWYAVLYRLTAVQGATQALRQQVIDLIDRQMSFVQVREALERLKQEQLLGFPLDLLQFKLSKIFYHMLDFERARQSLEIFVAEYPEHEFSQEAGKMLKKIMDRNRVNPQSVGVLLPLTGQFRDYGRRTLEGIQLGAGIFNHPDNASNDRGPVLVIRDTGGDPDRATQQVEDLVFNEHVIAIIGPMMANVSYAAAVKAEELEIPIIALSKRNGLTQIGPYVFRNFLTLATQAKLLVAYAMQQLGVTKFALLYPNDYYGVEFSNAFWDEVDRRRGEIRAAEHYEPDAKNFSAPIKKLVGRYYLDAREDFMQQKQRIRREIKSPLGRRRAMKNLVKNLEPLVDFHALFVPDYVDNAVLVAPALAFEDIILQTENQWKIDRMKKSMGREELNMVYLLGGNGWNSPKVIQWAQRYVQGVLFCDGFFLDSKRPATRAFVEKFKTNFDREPSTIEAEAFDTAKIVKTIIEKHQPPDRRTFREHLLGLKNFPGASGDTSFRSDGEADKSLFLLTIKNDKIIEVNPRLPVNAGTG